MAHGLIVRASPRDTALSAAFVRYCVGVIRPVFLLSLLPLVLGFVACAPVKGDRTAPIPMNVTVGEVELFRDNGSGERGEATTEFRTTDQRMHFTLQADKHVENMRTKWTLTAVKTTIGEETEFLSIEQPVTGDRLTATFSIPTLWPSGTYRVDFAVDGKPVAKKEFQVVGDGKPVNEIALVDMALLKDDNGKPGSFVAAFKPEDRKMHFEVKTLGSLPGEKKSMDVKWEFVFLGGGKRVPVHTVSNTIDVKPNLTLTAELSLPRDWPVGQYEAVVYLDGEKANTFKYEVE